MSDRDLPDVSSVIRGGPNRWVRDWSGTVGGTVRDFGLGLAGVEVSVGHTAWSDGFSLGCLGTSWAPCPESAPVGVSIDTADAELTSAEGRLPVTLKATDILGHESSLAWGDLLLDRSGPAIEELSGSLWDGRIQAEPGQALTRGRHTLTVRASDGVPSGTPTQRRSGVRGVEFRVDGQVELAADAVSCSSDSCGRQRSWTFSTASFPAGRHTVTVVATDQVGNQSSRAFDVTVPPAGELSTPLAGTVTSRWLELEVRSDVPELTTVRFQYRRPLGTWADLPGTALVDREGLPVGSVERPLTGGVSASVFMDVPRVLPGIPGLASFNGPFEVRGVFAGGDGGVSRPVRVRFDERGLGSDNARADVGPGTTDLVTGNLSFSSTDASIASFAQDLTVARSFNSRDPSAEATGPFGPGWVTSVPVEGAAVYASLQEVSDPFFGAYVEVRTSDGSSIFFTPLFSGTYASEPGYEDLSLAKLAADRFELRDSDGNVVVFVREPGTAAALFVPREVRQPGSENTSTISYEVVAGRPRVKRVLAPVPAGVSCANVATAGCRSLELVYAGATTAAGFQESGWGSYAGRVERVDFTAFDPQANAVRTDTVVRYLYDSTGRLRAVWDPRVAPALKERYAYDADGRLSSVTPPGETAWELTYAARAGDGDGGRISRVSRSTPQGVATTTVVYGVPVAGPGAPYALGASDVAAWNQVDHPLEGTAVFPPDAVPADPPASFARAVVHYVNRTGREVNTATPGGHITTSEYDRYGNIVRSLSAANRQRALANGTASAATAVRLDTRRRFDADGQEMTDELGPEHDVELADGSIVRGRRHTAIRYDEGAPAGTNAHLPTTTTVSAAVGGDDLDARVTTAEYDWMLRKAKKTTTDAGGLNLVEYVLYDAGTGLEVARFKPRHSKDAPYTLAASIRTYYRANGSGTCGWRPQYANLLCRSYAGADLTTDAPGELPSLPATTYSYNRLNEVSQAIEAVDGRQRVTTVTFDDAGRKLRSQVTSSTDGAGPVAAYGFEERSGMTVTDLSGHGNHGTMTGATRVADGRFGSALRFSGAGSEVTIPGAASLDLQRAATLEAWIRPEMSTLGFTDVIRKTGTSSCSTQYGLLALSVPQPGRARPVVQWCSVMQSASDTWEMPNGLWSHLVATNDGTTTKLYIDGRVADSRTAAIVGVSSRGELRIGRDFVGAIDEVRIYDRALQPDEIVSDMGTAVAPHDEPVVASARAGLVAAYEFEEGEQSAVIEDSSSNANHGTLGAQRTTRGHHGHAIDSRSPGATVPDSDSLDVTGGLTVEAWVCADTTTGNAGGIVTKEGAFTLRSSTAGLPEFAIDPVGRGESTYVRTPALTSGAISARKAYHLAGTYDGFTVKLYIDGVLSTSRSALGTIAVNTLPLLIGRSALGSFRGQIDSVRIYNRALSAAEISDDAATAIVRRQSTASMGMRLPVVTTSYDPATGRPTSLTTIQDGVSRSVATGYDSLGRVTSYTDADGNTSTTTYDLLGRPVQLDDGKGTQTLDYDPVTGLLASLDDVHAGRFAAGYDADGQMVARTLPNGLEARTTFDESGAPRRLIYEKTSSCASDCVWSDERVTESVHGQWRTHDSTFGSRVYRYDGAGRLAEVRDTPAGAGCTTRSYEYDVNSNRTRRVERAPAGGGSCVTSGPGTEQTSRYDGADRVVGSGFTYDLLGRLTAVPASHAGGGTLRSTYYVNDMVQSQAQDGMTIASELDPTLQRHRRATAGDGTTEIVHYADGSDSPVWSERSQAGSPAGWTRSVVGIGGDLAAIYDSASGRSTLQVTNLHGDVVATASTSLTTPRFLETFRADEFGNPQDVTPARYGWLGGKRRATQLQSGVIQMGVRSYIPGIGRFTSVDPVDGGSANAYEYAYQDPIDNRDLTGEISIDARAWARRVKERAKQIAADVGRKVGIGRKHAEALVGTCVKGSTIGAIAAFGDAAIQYRTDTQIYLEGQYVVPRERWQLAKKRLRVGFRAAAKGGPFGLLAACFGGALE